MPRVYNLKGFFLLCTSSDDASVQPRTIRPHQSFMVSSARVRWQFTIFLLAPSSTFSQIWWLIIGKSCYTHWNSYFMLFLSGSSDHFQTPQFTQSPCDSPSRPPYQKIGAMELWRAVANRCHDRNPGPLAWSETTGTRKPIFCHRLQQLPEMVCWPRSEWWICSQPPHWESTGNKDSARTKGLFRD